MTAKEIAKKYVYGNHDALTDKQEAIEMVQDIAQKSRLKNYRMELIQVAAVAVQMVESLDRNELN